ncbi:class I SAM-dependent methyltransferase [Nocardia huaxiensis]|uniref:Methyltransferase domain-containing protein n=1 Tax=Nocardia huaxiensis TaxID=2755382 RepID=A0A7D6ZJ11_9NOCA|nr:class I SAM-dependent methyltransferase [Nocardia huaxiensis]QLY31747.1 methyltransferase domain-containing protein [Nocardia huaxiensis]UFS95308.1 methyltransferase domain-containing protein [Nocardia huaxiensis]
MTLTTADLPVETLPERTRRWARECYEWAKVPLLPPGERAGRIYDIVGPQNLFGEDSLFINLGYWRDRPATLDEASRDLARLVAREAELGPGDVQVDVGCGYGDQDFLWAEEFGPLEITGMNIAVEQIEIANRRAAELGLADRIRFTYGSAVALPRESESCTKVTALESAFHFPSHTQFFAEAHRILQPGGKLVAADIVPRANPFTDFAIRVGDTPALRRLPGTLHERDVLDLPRYRKALQQAGFTDVTTYSIRRDVYRPLARHLGKRLRAPDMRRVNPVLRATFSRPGLLLWGPWADYIIAVGTKK